MAATYVAAFFLQKMPHSSLSPLSVVQYSKDYIVEFVRYITGWEERSEVANKPQLHYLCKYLETDHINCKTIVVESDYIDRHYLEDYAEYYARCFPSHPRKCSRLHFFSESFSETECIEFLEGKNDSFSEKLRRTYLGFAVIRPIPRTIFARICLQPYKALQEDSNYRLITRRVEASLFGEKLTVETIPFIEQDKVVSACATSALWVALSAHKDVALNKLPSPSAITKAATSKSADAARVFPTTGLTPPQILMGLRSFGLEPSIVWTAERSINELKAHIYSYLSNETTVILGGDIYAQNGGGDYKKLGSHLVCVTGYGMESFNGNSQQRLSLYSELLSKLYVHDDRCGPYLKIAVNPESFNVHPDPNKGPSTTERRSGKNEGSSKYGLRMAVQDLSTNYFVPSVAIVGLYHKIRIPYSHIEQTCAAFFQYLEYTIEDLRIASRDSADAEAADFYESTAGSLDSMISACWEISLLTSNQLKEEVLASSNFFSFNGLTGKSSLLLQNLPRFIWRCRVFGAEEVGDITEILFDATEVPQGNILIGYISKSQEAQQAWGYVDECIRDRIWQRYKITEEEPREHIGAFVKFFGKASNISSLNTYYGPIGLPRRSLKQGETDDTNGIAQRVDTHTVRRGDAAANWSFLSEEKLYIWVINEEGDIVIGEDVNKDGDFKGHPTLIDGRPGRIAGELHTASTTRVGKWVINLKSRAYSGHVAEVDRAQYLTNVIRQNFRGLDVTIEE